MDGLPIEKIQNEYYIVSKGKRSAVVFGKSPFNREGFNIAAAVEYLNRHAYPTMIKRHAGNVPKLYDWHWK